ARRAVAITNGRAGSRHIEGNVAEVPRAESSGGRPPFRAILRDAQSHVHSATSAAVAALSPPIGSPKPTESEGAPKQAEHRPRLCAACGWCPRSDSNRHASRRGILSPL